jgi:hypothetical protein
MDRTIEIATPGARETAGPLEITVVHRGGPHAVPVLVRSARASERAPRPRPAWLLGFVGA